MNKLLYSSFPFWIVVIVLTLFSLYGIRTIPFHPDESTYIFMSGDLEIWLSNPISLAYNLENQNDPKQRYRLIDPPLPRYIIGLGRSLAGFEPLQTDWDWGKSWEENQQAGALPGPDLLFASRLAVTLLLPLSLIFVYLTGKKLSGGLAGIVAMAFLGTNALVLLHGRRAMAEGAVIFSVSLLMWSLLRADKRAWLAGLVMALALNSKQSTLALFPVGLLAVAWVSSKSQHRLKTVVFNEVQFVGVFLVVSLLLNPVFWRLSLDPLKAAIQERQELVQRQTADTQRLAPEKYLNQPGERAIAILANLYVTPPMFFEIGNYIENTHESEEAYLSIPGTNLGRNFLVGGGLLFLTLLGIIAGLFQFRRGEGVVRRGMVLILLGTVFQFGGLLLAVPLPWQRYVVPLLPFVALWVGFGVDWIVEVMEVVVRGRGESG